MESKQKMSILNKSLIIMIVICIVLGTAIILLSSSKTQIEIAERSGDKNNATAEETSETNTWDISATENDNVIATLSDDGTLTIWGTGAMKDFYSSDGEPPWYEIMCVGDIKKVIIKEGVTTIGAYAFVEGEELEKIEIANTVRTINSKAFAACFKITSINIPASVTTISTDAFEYCHSLTDIKVDDANDSYSDVNGVLYTKDKTELLIYPKGKYEQECTIFWGTLKISDGAFSDSYGPNTIELPLGLTTIGNSAFSNCYNLEYIKIPSTVTSIGYYAFGECENLNEIDVDENNYTYMDDNGVLYTKDKKTIIKYPEGKELKEYKILDGVTTIQSAAFSWNDNLINVEIPKGVERIEYAAFWHCHNISEIIIPEGTTYIGSKAFYFCQRLEKIEIPNSITNMGSNVFDGCRVINLIETTRESVELPNILKRTQDENDILYSSEGIACSNCTIEDGQIKINNKNQNARVTVWNGKLENLSYNILYNKWDASEKNDESIMATLSNDGTLTFNGTGKMKDFETVSDRTWDSITWMIKKVEIDDRITKIGRLAFSGCEYLTDIEIGSNITEIGDYAFGYCENLKNIDVTEGNLSYMDDNGILYTKDGSKIVRYPQARTENEYSILNNVTTIGKGAFEYCDSLTSIKIPKSVTSIEDDAFYDCGYLLNIEIPKGVTRIGKSAFTYCQSLTSIKIPEGITTIEEDTFLYCISLVNVEMPNSITTIGDSAFSECWELKSIKIPSNVTKIAREAFWGCESLTNIEIPKGVTSIEENTFERCVNLTNILIPDSVINIAEDVFFKNYKLTIWCKKDSAAHTYAQKNQINYLVIMDDIQPKTTAQQIKEKIEIENEYKILDTDGNEVADTEIVLTGYTAQTDSGENYLLAIKGDCNGDGQADIKDILAINKHRLNKASLTMEYSLAGDVNEDGQVDIRDILQINKFRLGKINEL